jgi:hypothetical protein
MQAKLNGLEDGEVTKLVNDAIKAAAGTTIHNVKDK